MAVGLWEILIILLLIFAIGAGIRAALEIGSGIVITDAKGNIRSRLLPCTPLPSRWVIRICEKLIAFFDYMRITLLPPPLIVTEMLIDFWKNQAIYVAVRFGLPDLVPLALKPDENWPTVDELAFRAGVADPDGLYKVMRLLATVYIFKEHKGRRFSHTKLSVYLRKDHPTTGRSFALCYGSEQVAVWKGLYHSLKTGEPAFPYTHGGKNFWDFLNSPENKDNLLWFQAMFDDISRVMTPPLVKDFDWAGLIGGKNAKAKIVDVGGGLGGVLALILETLPNASGILFDQDQVIEQARRQKRWGGTESSLPLSQELEESEKKGRGKGKDREETDLSDRATLISGSFMEYVPEGGDVYVMRMILHDWSDEECIKILRNVKSAMLGVTGEANEKERENEQRRGRKKTLIVMETVLPEEGTGPSYQVPVSAEFVNVHMKLMFNGQERSESQFASLFESAGFKYIGTTYTRGTFHIIRGEPL